MRLVSLSVLSVSLLWGCGAESSISSGRTGTTANGLYSVTYRPSPDPIPFAELFDLHVTVSEMSGAPAKNATLGIKVTMPAHGHGMQTSPQVSSEGEGKFTVSGMKFHMRGTWQLAFTVEGSAGVDAVTLPETFE